MMSRSSSSLRSMRFCSSRCMSWSNACSWISAKSSGVKSKRTWLSSPCGERLARDVLVGVDRVVGDVLEQQRVAGRLGLAARLRVGRDGDARVVEVGDEGAVDAAVGVGGLDAGRARLGQHAADPEVADVRLDLGDVGELEHVGARRVAGARRAVARQPAGLQELLVGLPARGRGDVDVDAVQLAVAELGAGRERDAGRVVADPEAERVAHEVLVADVARGTVPGFTRETPALTRVPSS